MSEHGLLTHVKVRTPKKVRVLGYVAGVAVVAGIAVLAMWPLTSSETVPSSAEPVQAEWLRPVVSELGLIEKTGVRVVRVATAGGGGLLDLRFQVLDPDKAAAIHDLETPPAILDETTGLLVHELYMGHSHTARFKTAVTYYLVFENPGDLVRRGSVVSVLLGDAQIEHIVVE